MLAVYVTPGSINCLTYIFFVAIFSIDFEKCFLEYIHYKGLLNRLNDFVQLVIGSVKSFAFRGRIGLIVP